MAPLTDLPKVNWFCKQTFKQTYQETSRLNSVSVFGNARIKCQHQISRIKTRHFSYFFIWFVTVKNHVCTCCWDSAYIDHLFPSVDQCIQHRSLPRETAPRPFGSRKTCLCEKVKELENDLWPIGLMDMNSKTWQTKNNFVQSKPSNRKIS